MKESEIRPKELFQKYLELSVADAVTHFGSSLRENISCPACEGEIGTPAFEKSGFGFVLCDACDTLYQFPRPPMEDFLLFYQENPSARYWAKTLVN